MNYKQLTKEKKAQIDILLEQGLSMRKTDEILGINHLDIKLMFIKKLSENSLYLLNRDELKSGMNLIHEYIVSLCDHHVLIEVLDIKNSVYHNGIYLIDPGSYQKCETIPTSVVYSMNVDLVNEYLLRDVFRKSYISVQNDYHKINAVMD